MSGRRDRDAELRARRAARGAPVALAAVRRPQRHRLRRGRRRRPPHHPDHVPQAAPGRRLRAARRPDADLDRRRDADRRDQRRLAASVESTSVLRVDVDRGGDYSPYVLTLDAPGLDEVAAASSFSFMAAARPTSTAAPRRVRRSIARRAAARLPRQGLRQLPPAAARPAADAQPRLGRAQSRPTSASRSSSCSPTRATGSPTSRTPSPTRPTSTRCGRGSRRAATQSSIDYRMHDGRNAWAPVHFAVTATVTLPRGTALFTRLAAPLPGSRHAARAA